jgi:hypothetical protein
VYVGQLKASAHRTGALELMVTDDKLRNIAARILSHPDIYMALAHHVGQFLRRRQCRSSGVGGVNARELSLLERSAFGDGV